MMKAIVENPFDRAVIDGVTQFLLLAKKAKSAEMTILINTDGVPTMSYKIEELYLIAEKGGE